MKKRITWPILSCLIATALLIVSCAPAVTEETEVVSTPEKEVAVTEEVESATTQEAPSPGTEQPSPQEDETPSTGQITLTTYELSVSVNPVGAGSVSHPSGDYEEGLQIPLKATPSSGYQFASWSGDVSGTSPTIMIIMDSNKKVTANFERIKHDLSISVSPQGSGTINPTGGTYDSGAQVTLTATPLSGYRFVSWSGDVSGTSPVVTILMDSNKNVTANFARQSVWVTPMNATASGSTQWGGTWYTGPPSFAIDGNEITAWTLNGMGEITFDLGSAKLIGGIEAYWAGSVTNGNTVNVYIDGVQVLTNEKFGATKNIRYFTPIRGRLVKYQTVALPHNEYLQVAGWSEVAEFRIFVQEE